MARQPRIYGRPDSTYSIHNRINDPEIKRFYDRKIARLIKSIIKDAKARFSFELIFLTIMGNHVHYKIRPHKEGPTISVIMHWIDMMIAIRYNKVTGHVGRLWRERFKSCVLEDIVYFMNSGAYIALNPERAGIAAVEDYEFGSAIYLYRPEHPFPEFEEFRDMFDEPFEGYYEQIKKLITEKRLGRISFCGVSMAPRKLGRPYMG